MTKKSQGKKIATLLSGIAVGGMVCSLSSYSTVEKSNEVAIDEIYDQISELKEDVESIKMMSEEEAWQEPSIGQISMFGGNFAPRGWAFCNGQLLSISEHQALFSILGTTYGGDGRTTFGLPDLQGRMPLHTSSKIPLGRKGRIKSKITHHGPEAHDDEIFTLGQDGYQAVNFVICLTGNFPSRN